MPKGARALAAACAGAMWLTAPAAAALPVSAERMTLAPTSSEPPPPTFIEALAAVPDATRTLTQARRQLREDRLRQAAAEAVALSAQRDLDVASSTVCDTKVALTRADVAAARAQETVDDAARILYSSGGAVPTLVDVVLTADGQLGLAHSLVTRAHLAAAGNEVVPADDRADEAQRRAAGARATAIADYRRLMRLTRVDRSEEYGRIRGREPPRGLGDRHAGERWPSGCGVGH